jgi:peroxiredoxin Q/BCP
MRHSRLLVAAAAALVLAAPARAQDPAPDPGPKVGDMAPDFVLPASTKDGLRSSPLRLTDLRGQVVVLAFFPRARTGG